MSKKQSALAVGSNPSRSFRAHPACVDLAIVGTVLLLNTATVQLGLCQGSGQAAVIVGHVRDAEGGRPIEAAEVHLVADGEDLVRITDGEGVFLFPKVQPKTYELVLEHLAYGVRSESLEVQAGQVATLDLQLTMKPIELEPLVVRARYRPLVPRLAGFYERMSMGHGHFITLEDIERRQPARITNMIQEIPAVRMLLPEGRGTCLAPYFRGRIDFQRKRLPCYPDIYLDGIRLNQRCPYDPGRLVPDETCEGYVCLDDFIVPSEVEAVEVYDGAAEFPAVFGGPTAGCGVIAVWTRRGR